MLAFNHQLTLAHAPSQSGQFLRLPAPNVGKKTSHFREKKTDRSQEAIVPFFFSILKLKSNSTLFHPVLMSSPSYFPIFIKAHESLNIVNLSRRRLEF